jgi:glycosyltransferase involved in cell wall biosynthesis
MILGIDASTPGSGGGKRHLIEILKRFKSGESGFSKIRIWGVQTLLDELPENTDIEKYSHNFLNRGLLLRIVWQIFFRDNVFKNKFDLLLSPFGTYSSASIKYVPMCRNMLLFDKAERKRFGISLTRIKLKLLQIQQIRSFKKSTGVIFLSTYAERMVRNSIGNNIPSRIISHGVSYDFRNKPKPQQPISSFSILNPFKLLYVSSVWPYKHQLNVVEAIIQLRKEGYPISLQIIGKNDYQNTGKNLLKKLNEQTDTVNYINWEQNVTLDDVSDYYKNSHGFIFASTCENMPNILIEAMSAGLPILCSSFQPMTEFLKDGGIYFDPTNVEDLKINLRYFLENDQCRNEISAKSYNESFKYSWDKCASETYDFLYYNLNK